MRWDFGNIAPLVPSVSSGWKINRYSALKDCGDGVEAVACDTAEEAKRTSEDGLARLLAFDLGPRAAAQLRLPKFPFQTAFYLKNLGYAEKTVAEDVLLAAVKECAVAGLPQVFTEAEFAARRELVRKGLSAKVAQLLPLATETLNRAAALSLSLETGSRLPDSAAEGIKNQLAWLVFPGFVRRIPSARLRHYPRYFDAMTVRMERARLDPAADARRQEEIDGFWTRYRNLVADAKEMRFAKIDALVEYRWMVEEYRVSLFAQELKTPTPVSAKRLDAQWRLAVRSPAAR